MAAVRTPEPAPAGGLQRLLAFRASEITPARWRSRLTAGLAGAAMTVTALAGLVAVSDGSRPGDVLYELKRGTERTQLALAGDARGHTLLDFASTRLQEVAALVGAGGTAFPATPAGPAVVSVSGADDEPALVLDTLATMDEQTAEGAVWLAGHAVATGDAQPLDHLAEWAAGQSAELAAVQPRVPEWATDAVGQSRTLLTEIGVRTDDLQRSLACPGGPAVAGTDDLGPVPAPCSASEPAPPGTSGSTTAPGATEPGDADPRETVPGDSDPENSDPENSDPENSEPGNPDPGLPTAPPTSAPGGQGGSGTGSLPSLPAPATPRLPLPAPPLPLPLPTTLRPAPTPPTDPGPPIGSIRVCLPPLIAIGC
jgi:hypothetical protein